MIGPVYWAEISEQSARLLGRAGERAGAGGVDGFVAYIGRDQGIDPAWRDSVLRFTRERMLAAPPPRTPWSQALRQVPRSRPFEIARRAGGTRACRRSSSPATTRPIPGIPTRSPTAYAAALPRGATGQRGGGGVAAGLAGGQALAGDRRVYRGHYLHHYEIPDRSHCCGGSSPSSRRSGSALRPTSRSPTPVAGRRPAWPAAAVARRSPTAPTRTSPASTSPSSGSSATSLLLPSAFFVNDLARFGGFAVSLGGFGFSIYLTYLEILEDRSDLPVVRGQRGADDDPLPAQRHALDRLRGNDRRRRGAWKGLMSNKKEREKRREERIAAETQGDSGDRRTRILQIGAGRCSWYRRGGRRDRRQLGQQRQRRRPRTSRKRRGRPAARRDPSERTRNSATEIGAGRTDRVRRPAVPDLQGQLRRSHAADDQEQDQGPAKRRSSSATSRSSARNRSRPAPRRSPPASRGAAGTSSRPSTATRARSAPATSPTNSSKRSPKRAGVKDIAKWNEERKSKTVEEEVEARPPKRAESSASPARRPS